MTIGQLMAVVEIFAKYDAETTLNTVLQWGHASFEIRPDLVSAGDRHRLFELGYSPHVTRGYWYAHYYDDDDDDVCDGCEDDERCALDRKQSEAK